MTINKVLLTPEQIAEMKAYIDDRFRDRYGIEFDTLRRVAKCTIDDIAKGNLENARRGIERLGEDSEQLLLKKLGEIGFRFE